MEKNNKNFSRINLEFGAGSTTILYSLEEGRFFDYESDSKELHEKFGGKMFYSSQSGLSGKGWIEPDTRENSLIVCGGYRTDARFEQWGLKREGISIMVPYKNHVGIDREYPVVVVYRKEGVVKVDYFYRHYDVKYLLKGEGEGEYLDKKVSYFIPGIENREKTFEYSFRADMRINSRWVSPIRFLDLEYPTIGDNRESLLCKKVGLHLIDGEYYHKTKFNVFDSKVDPTNPGYGWVYEEVGGEGLYWKRDYKDNVFIFSEKETEGELFNYEEELSFIEFFFNKEKVLERVIRGLNNKIKIAAAQKRAANVTDTQLKDWVATNPTVTLSVEDSYAVGNCAVGTENFIKEHELSNGVTLGELAKHPSWEAMLNKREFKRALINKMLLLS